MLEAARVDRGAGDGRLTELLGAGVDWRRLRETAARHGLFPLLYDRIRKLGGDPVPADEAARMGEIFAAHARRNLVATARLLKVLGALEERGLPAIPLKGPTLAEAAYGDVSMRQFADLDILVREGDLRAVGELLTAQGYELARPMTARQERAHLERTCELSFVLPGRGVFLDVHWRLAADYMAPAADTAAIFARHGEGRLQGRPVRALAPEDLLLFLCIHGAFHLWDSLGLVSDVARLVASRGGWDWEALAARAESSRQSRTLLLGLSLARELLGAAIPAAIGRRADADAGIAALRAEVCRGLFAGEGSEPGFGKTALFQLRARDGLRDRLSYCAIRAFSPTLPDWELVRLPDRLYFLYYLLRPLRLAGFGNVLRARGPADG